MKMTDYGGVDSFFDLEPHDSPVLKGEYKTSASPVREKTLLNSPNTSPNNMSKSKGPRSCYSDSRSGSRSRSRSRSRSPENTCNGYSDSFDSEDSAQDSRPSSQRTNKSKMITRKNNKATVNKRTSSTYSRDSRYSTSSNVTSSGYGKPRKSYSTAVKRKKINKGGNKGRASSISNSGAQRNVTEVTKRMLSAKGHTINRLRSENEEIKQKYEESVREIRLLKQLQRKQERALDKFEGTESELPELLRKHSAELDSLHQRMRKYKEKDRSKERQLKEQHDELCKLQSELKKMKKVAGDKHLMERDSLQHRLEKQTEQLNEKEKRIVDLEHYIENIRKNQNHQLKDIRTREQELKGQNAALAMENERLQVQLREKDKELDIRNIYSHRVMKVPVKLHSTRSPTSPSKIMVDKSTTTENLVQSPHPPEAPKRTSSAEIRQQISEKKMVEKEKKPIVVEKEKKPVVIEKEKKELDEHELILQQLDLGIQKEKKDEEDDVMKSLAMAKKRREEQRLKEEEERRKEKQLLREKEEELRLKKEEEEERLRLKKIRDEAIKGYVPTFITSTKPTNIPRPVPLGSHVVPSKPTVVGNQPPVSNAQQTISKPVPARNPTGKEPSTQKAKPIWFSGLTANTSNSNMEQQRLEKDSAKPIKPNTNPAKASVLILSDDDDEEDVPYFGSKPKNNQTTYAVNSVRGLQEYSTERSGSAEKATRAFGGNKTLGEEPNKKVSYNPMSFGSHTTTSNQKEQEAEVEKMNREKEEARRKKDELLAKMREIDQKNEKPESGKSRKSYKFTDPVENLHNGRPSHGLGSAVSLSKDDDELAFGSYAPTFSKGNGLKKHQSKPFTNGYTNEKKSDLLSNLFGKGDSEKSSGSPDDDEVMSSGPKAKPIKDKSAFPWDSGVESGKETGAKTGRRAGRNDDSLFGADNKAPPYIGKLAVNEVDDIEDDLEEVLL